MSVVYDEIIKSYVDGTYGKEHWVAMDNGAIYLLEPNKAVPQDIRTELKAIEKKVKSGAVQMVDLPVAADLHKYLRKTFPK
jgi:basic membrane lipoprotein Med (substrate-binding protein (PBP1-ABC) superfamily)